MSATLPEGLGAVRAAPPSLVRAGIERIYAHRASPLPPWLRDLLRRDAQAFAVLDHALHDAFTAALQRSWPTVQSLHRAEVTRYALTAAGSGIGRALVELVPGSRLVAGAWELSPHYRRDVHLGGRGLILLPTFHWTCVPLVLDQPDQPVLLVYPAGPGVPPAVTAGHRDPLAAMLGRTRADILRLLAEEHTTSEVARLAGISISSASEHTAVLRAAGLITTVRTGTAACHHRTALGTLLIT